MINQQYDPQNENHLVRLKVSFTYKNHACLVFEILGMSLLDILTQNQFRGLPLTLVQRFTRQILKALLILEEANVIHCDLKPENILLDMNTEKKSKTGVENSQQAPSGTTKKSSSSAMSADVKVIDFGSACFEGHAIYSYIQSRFYRSPEVLLGIPYTGAIDMWSLACVCTEMYLGLPLFPGISHHNQLSRITDMFGCPPDFLIERNSGSKYFTLNDQKEEKNDKNSETINETDNEKKGGTGKYRLKTAEEYAADTNTEVPTLRKYLRYNKLEEIILKCPLPNKVFCFKLIVFFLVNAVMLIMNIMNDRAN